MLLAGMVFLGACAGSGQGKTTAIHAPRPPEEYTYLGSGDLTKPKNINLVIDFDTPKNDSLLLPVMFGMAFSNAIHEGTAPAPKHVGDGGRTASPISFPSVAAGDELDASGDYMAATFPDHEAVVGHLFSGPQDSYLMWVQFKTRAGDNAIYFDVTRWARARKSELP